jgi:hypothetical protein
MVIMACETRVFRIPDRRTTKMNVPFSLRLSEHVSPLQASYCPIVIKNGVTDAFVMPATTFICDILLILRTHLREGDMMRRGVLERR